MRRCEQAINELLIGIGPFVGEELRHFSGTGRETDQIEGESADERPFVGRGRWRETVLSEFDRDERVDWIGDRRLRSVRNRHSFERLDRPELPCFCPVDLFPFRLHRNAVLGNKRSVGEPLREQFDFGFRQLSLGGHLQLGIAVLDRFQQQALLRLACHEDRPAITPLQQRRSRIDCKLAALTRLVLRMTFVTTLHQQRPNLLLEEFGGGSFVDRNRLCRRRPSQREATRNGKYNRQWLHQKLLVRPD